MARLKIEPKLHRARHRKLKIHEGNNNIIFCLEIWKSNLLASFNAVLILR